MTIYRAVPIEELPTIAEIKEKFKGARNLEIETHPLDKNRIISVSCREGCILCGKFHRMGSKAEQVCNFLVLATMVKVIGAENDCN